MIPEKDTSQPRDYSEMDGNWIKTDIVIADSQFLVVEALKSVLSSNYSIKKVVSCKKDLYSLLKSDIPGLLIIDPVLFDFDGITDLKEIRDLYPGMALVVLTNNITRNELKDLNKLGIKNILHKNTEPEELFFCLSAALKGKKHYSDIFIDMIVDTDENKVYPADSVQLTTSEKEIVRLIAQGLTTKEIASILFLSMPV